MPKIEFNLNEYVWVRLSPLGKTIAKKYYFRTTFSPSGWEKYQLWQLMSVFGGSIAMGSELPFEDTTIRLDEPTEAA